MYCVPDDVKKIIDTSFEDQDITAMISVADAEIDERDIDVSPGVRKQISMLITASLIGMNDTRSRAVGATEGTYKVTPNWRKLAENLISNTMKPKGKLG
jgi:hypothetical protein